MRLVFMGTPQFAVPTLEYLVLNDYCIEAVYTRPDKPVGRGRKPKPPPVKEAANRLGLRVVQPVSLRHPEVISELDKVQPDAIVVAALGLIIPPDILSLPRYGCINIHPSLLPRYRGASPVASAILAGDSFTGISIMLLDEGLDTGPVLGQAQVAIAAIDTQGSLSEKLALVAARFLVDLLPRWTRGEVLPRPQPSTGVTTCSRLTPDMGALDFTLGALDLERRVRAFWPWPGAYTLWNGKRVKILEAVALPVYGLGPPGRVVALDVATSGAALGITTRDGVLGILRLQMEGKRPLSGAEFLRGEREFVGAKLGL